MADKRADTDSLQVLLDRLNAGAPGAVDDLIAHSQERLRRLTRKMLGQRPDVHRWEGTEDVLQNALVRLCHALGEVKLASPRHYLHLAALQVRRELIALARHHYGPHGHGAHHASDPGPAGPEGDNAPLHEVRADSGPGPLDLLQFAELHEHANALPEEEREVFGLVFYQGLSQEQVAAQLGVSVPTVKRRWRSARLLLHEATKTDVPDLEAT